LARRSAQANSFSQQAYFGVDPAIVDAQVIGGQKHFSTRSKAHAIG